MHQSAITAAPTRWAKQNQIDAHIAALDRYAKLPADSGIFKFLDALHGNVCGPIDWRHPLERIAARAAASGQPVVAVVIP